ncbi:hypothetical protein MFMK1_002251 [Metallumcola ferriviriculae]|uniref:Uncharacterized protein n=1 Tax=Metallumcola ferriviriculae TaxID=3039180 RepID=A0AAU0UPF7_9FIRM|nr:hypothetical protein MFMK1_002251 [Desulfitibacteraceae bacterium MK1]
MRRLVLAFIWIGYKKGLKSTINACILAAIVFGTLDFFYGTDPAGGIGGGIALYLAMFWGTLVGIRKGKHFLSGIMVSSTFFLLVTFLSGFAGIKLSPLIWMVQIILAFITCVAALFAAEKLSAKSRHSYSRSLNA